jgi:hypothetical protein
MGAVGGQHRTEPKAAVRRLFRYVDLLVLRSLGPYSATRDEFDPLGAQSGAAEQAGPSHAVAVFGGIVGRTDAGSRYPASGPLWSW